MVRYQGPGPHMLTIKRQPSTIDDGTYHGSFQDFYFGARYKLVESSHLALTPFVEAIVPSHHYEPVGQSAIGRDLRALVVGAAVGGFADDLIPGLFFQTRLSYARVQEIVDIRPNRTGIDSAVDTSSLHAWQFSSYKPSSTDTTVGTSLEVIPRSSAATSSRPITASITID